MSEMVNTTMQMYRIAQAVAIENGPRVIGVDGVRTAVYGLSRSELKKIFSDNLYQVRRKTWLQNIEDWRDRGAIVPKGIADRIKLEEPFWVIFTEILPPDMLTLMSFAEDNGVSYIPRQKEIFLGGEAVGV